MEDRGEVRAKDDRGAGGATAQGVAAGSAPAGRHIDECFRRGFAHHEAGRLVEAAAVYHQILAVEPTHADSLHLLGVIAHQLGWNELAIDYMTRAIRLNPAEAIYHSNLSNSLRAVGRLEEAAASCREALRLKPDFAEAHNNLGNVLQDLGRPEEAEASYRATIRLKPDYADVHSNLANVLTNSGRLDAAMESYRAALRLNPGHVGAQCNLAHLFARLGRLAEAEPACRRALELRPDFAEAYNTLGNVQKELGRLGDAEASYRAAIRLNPNYPGALSNLGNVLRQTDRLEEAEACHLEALRLSPNFSAGHNNLGNIYLDKGEVDRAIAEFRLASAADPHKDGPISNLLFALCFAEGADPDAVYREHLQYNQRIIVPLRPRRRQHANTREPERKLRVGYVCADFRRHASGHYLMPVFRNHDHAQFEIFAYYNRQTSDDWTAEMRSLADHWHVCTGLSDDALADQIVADRIDILVDCTGHMAETRLPMFGLKPAPIQISFPLYPNTTGVETIDYRIMDPYFAPPEADAYHSETLIRLPDVHACYAPLPEEMAPCNPPPCLTRGYVTFGSFNNFAKIGPSTVAAWVRILKEVPSARLRLKWLGLRERGAGRVTRRFAEAGADPARIELAGWAPHPYPPFRDLDICLDPLFPNGGTTTCDALWMGVPVVTMYGRTPFARVGLCHLTNIGLTELIARDPDEYVHIAADLARDPSRLAALHAGLRDRFAGSPLMDGRRYTKNLEGAYRRVWREYCASAESSVPDPGAPGREI